MECDTCHVLKLENENLKEQIKHLPISPSFVFIKTSERRKYSRKYFMENAYFTRNNRKSNSTKLVCHYYGD